MTRAGLTALVAVALGVGLLVLVRTPEADSAPAEAPAATPVVEAPAPAPMPVAAQPVRADPAPAPAAPLAAKLSTGNYPTETAALLRALRPLVREVEWGLEALDRRGGCKLGEAFVEVQLETGSGEVFVRGVTVKETPPGLPDVPFGDHDPTATPVESTDEALVQCVREAMAEKSLPAPSALPGRRWQATYRRPPRPL